MPKRSPSIETVHVCLELMRRIPKGRSVTAPQLKQQLAATGIERDLRTIERQLEALSTRFEIDRDDTSKPYRYSWRPWARGISLPSLTAEECLLLTLAEQQLRQLLPPRLMKSMSDFFSQARNQLDEQPAAERERAWLKKVRVVGTSQPLLPPKVDHKVFEQVCSAFYGDRWLKHFNFYCGLDAEPEPRSGIVCGDVKESLGDGLVEGFGGAGLDRTEDLLDLGPGLFDGVQIGGVGR